MQKMVIDLFPKVFLADKKQKIYVKIDGACAQDSVMIKIQPMEIYAIKHTERYRIDEENRYPYTEMMSEGDNVYSIEYAFFDEQKYDVKIKMGADVSLWTRIYSVKNDLAALRVYKGDTHLHTCRSDGEDTPFEVACQYRAAGFDFIAVTDHHRYAPSLEGKAAVEKWTNAYRVFRGEEVHNRDMGYFHIINFDGDCSVNDIVETQDEYVQSEVQKILAKGDIPDTVADKYDCAYRIFIAEQIQKAGGVAIMAHPYWDVYGEYHMPTATTQYLLRRGTFDAVELLAADDFDGNGDNLQVALWGDLRAEGYKIPVVGASDSHSRNGDYTLFNRHFSLVFADGFDDVKSAIKAGRSVAVLSFNDENFLAFGEFRYVKYARFLLKEYLPGYQRLTAKHGAAILAEDGDAVAEAEQEIARYNKKFFAF